MKKDGAAIIYEKFVEAYGDDALSKAHSGTNFYAERIFDMLRSERLTEEQLFALYNEMFLTSIRKCEFKVPLARFRQDVQKAGLSIDDLMKLWPEDDRFTDADVGDIVATLKDI